MFLYLLQPPRDRRPDDGDELRKPVCVLRPGRREGWVSGYEYPVRGDLAYLNDWTRVGFRPDRGSSRTSSPS